MSYVTTQRSGMGLSLTEIDVAIKECLFGSTAEIRYEARKSPINLEVRTATTKYVVSGCKLVKSTLVLEIDPEFGEPSYDGPDRIGDSNE